ncbi:TspO/MBR family protein [Mediterraneibacter sp. ICN-202921]|uniref:TspO/MBR family protein n=1 Tax=Mediterraneibacter sp. ICN-202921 TaxID=3134657 RepID=UPI0030C15314
MKWKALICSLLLTLGAGGFAAVLTADSMEKYQDMYHPPLAPPGWVFPFVWTLLYILMAISAYLVYTARPKEQTQELDEKPESKNKVLKLYLLQLAVNVIWPVLFFRFDLYLVSAVWIIGLWYLIFLTAENFYKIRPIAGKLLVPYFIWVTFAVYLNIFIAVYTWS